MKFKSFFLICLFIAGAAFADHRHGHQSLSKSVVQTPWTSNCEIEIANYSYDTIRVSGTFDDGTPLTPFYIYRYESPHYISLAYDGYCHNYMYLNVEQAYTRNLIYSGYTDVNTIILIVPSLQNQPKVELKAK